MLEDASRWELALDLQGLFFVLARNSCLWKNCRVSWRRDFSSYCSIQYDINMPVWDFKAMTFSTLFLLQGMEWAAWSTRGTVLQCATVYGHIIKSLRKRNALGVFWFRLNPSTKALNECVLARAVLWECQTKNGDDACAQRDSCRLRKYIGLSQVSTCLNFFRPLYFMFCFALDSWMYIGIPFIECG